jgi:putative oxidoreductase
MDIVDAVLATYPSWSHLVVRIALGIVFVAHGGQKVFGWFGGHGLRATIAAFKSMGVPAPAAARPVALGIIVIMLVAIAKVHARHGFFINFQGTPGKGHGFEFNFVLIAMALSILIGGAGVLSVDRAIWLALGGGD